MVCSGNNTCSSCKPGYNMIDNKCRVVCTIENCAVCLTTSLCSICKEGYTVSSDGKQCKLNCGIKDCLTCESKTTCSACNSVLTLSSDKKSCFLQCPPGFYIKGTSCESCQKTIPSCIICSISNSNLVCSSCL